MNSSKSRQNTLVFLGLPASAGIAVLVAVLIIALLPYLGGQTVGSFTVPALVPWLQAALMWVGPALLVLVLALFFPAWPVLKAGTPSDEDVRRWAAEHGFANPYDLGLRNYEQCLRDLGYQRMKKYRTKLMA